MYFPVMSPRAVFLSLLLVFGTLPAQSPLDYRQFTSGSEVWVISHGAILAYGVESRNLRTVPLSESAARDSIIDVVESDGELWVSSAGGLYRIAMSTSTVERMPDPGGGYHPGPLGVDFDFLWVASGGSLWRFDKLAYEWLAFEIEGLRERAEVLGVHSNGDEVFVAADEGMYVFSVLDEKWNSYAPAGDRIDTRTFMRTPGDALVLVEESRICRYLPDSRSWETVEFPGMLVDAHIEDTAMYILTDEEVFAWSSATSILRPLAIPSLTGASSIARRDSLLFLAEAEHILHYDITAETSTPLEYGGGVSRADITTLLTFEGLLLGVSESRFAVYDFGTSLWEVTGMESLKRDRRRVTWDENGLRTAWGPDAESVLRGSLGAYYLPYDVDTLIDTTGYTTDFIYDTAGAELIPGAVYDTIRNAEDSILLLRADGIPELDTVSDLFVRPLDAEYRANLTLHNEFAEGRYLDLFFDNSDAARGKVIKKGLYYRGVREDRLASVRAGTNDFQVSQSRTLPGVKLEGVAAALESKRGLEKRDRKVVRSNVGGGYLVSETRHEILAYHPSGEYVLGLFAAGASTGDRADTLKIVSGSVRLWVDGEEVDSSFFNVLPDLGRIYLTRRDIVDPTSVINVAYQVRTIPDEGVEAVELVPGNHLGSLGYADVTVSPSPWLSPRLGVYSLDKGGRGELINASTGVEFRKPGLLLKAAPEATIAARNGAAAAGMALDSRFFDRLSLSAHGLAADDSFETTDNLSRGYGALRHELDYKFTYDIFKDMPVSFYRHGRTAADGTEERYELALGAYFARFPNADISLSRNDANMVAGREIRYRVIDSSGALPDTSIEDSIRVDTLDSQKDKLRIRLYETSSPFVEELLNLYRVKYDLSLTQFTSTDRLLNQRHRGRTFYGRSVVNPSRNLTVSGSGTYRVNPGVQPSREIEPELQFQTIGLPPGTDVTGSYTLRFARLTDVDSSRAELTRSIVLQCMPGVWWSGLSWISPQAGLSRDASNRYADAAPRLSRVLAGERKVVAETLRRYVGASVYPGSRIDYFNRNTWTIRRTRETDTLSFLTDNDLKIRSGRGGLWQSIWRFDYTFGSGARRHIGSSTWRKIWLPWLSSEQGIAGSFRQGPGVNVLNIGPEGEVGFSVKDVFLIKTLLNNHSITVNWARRHGRFEPRPSEIRYTTDLRLILLPNITFINRTSLMYDQGGFGSFEGHLSLFVTF